MFGGDRFNSLSKLLELPKVFHHCIEVTADLLILKQNFCPLLYSNLLFIFFHLVYLKSELPMADVVSDEVAEKLFELAQKSILELLAFLPQQVIEPLLDQTLSL